MPDSASSASTCARTRERRVTDTVALAPTIRHVAAPDLAAWAAACLRAVGVGDHDAQTGGGRAGANEPVGHRLARGAAPDALPGPIAARIDPRRCAGTHRCERAMHRRHGRRRRFGNPALPPCDGLCDRARPRQRSRRCWRIQLEPLRCGRTVRKAGRGRWTDRSRLHSLELDRRSARRTHELLRNEPDIDRVSPCGRTAADPRHGDEPGRVEQGRQCARRAAATATRPHRRREWSADDRSRARRGAGAARRYRSTATKATASR